MGPTRVFKSTYGRVLTIGAAMVAAAALVSMIATDGPARAAAFAGLPLVGACAAWALFWRPAVIVSDGEIVLVNVLRTVRIPWPAFLGAESVLALTVATTAGTFTAWAAPAKSGTALRLPRPRRKTGDSETGPLTTGASSEDAALEIAHRHASLTAAGHLGGNHKPVPPTVSWHVGTISALVALVTWSVAAILFA